MRAIRDDLRCPDCRTRPGEFHAPGCDVARCTADPARPMQQRLACDGGHDCGQDVWQGEWPAPEHYVCTVRFFGHRCVRPKGHEGPCHCAGPHEPPAEPLTPRSRLAWLQSLLIWAEAMQGRDALIRGAYAAGIGKTRIHSITGVSRTTIDRVLADEEGQS